MVGPDGFEPSTPRLSSACSNQLSYEPGLKKSRSGSRWVRIRWKAFFALATEAVPFEAPEERRMEPAGFEPATPCLQSRCSAS